MKSVARILCGLTLLSLNSLNPNEAQAAPSKVSLARARLFVQTVRVMDSIETKNPVASASVLDRLIPSAYAGEGSACMTAGYVGTIKGGICKSNNGVEVRSGNTITCNPEVFGELKITKPAGSRWTYACANQFLKNAGIKKTVDQDLDPEEQQKLGQSLTGKSLDPSAVYEQVRGLCAAATASGRKKDINDCALLKTLHEQLVECSSENKPQECTKNPATPAVVTQALKALKPSQNLPPQNPQKLTLADRKRLYDFNPSEHIDCNQTNPPDRYSYGNFSFATKEEYHQGLGKTENGKVCYQRAFMEKALWEVSAQLKTAKFNKDGTSITIQVGTCDIDLNYLGTDFLKYPKAHDDDEQARTAVKTQFHGKVEYGAQYNSEDQDNEANVFPALGKSILDGNHTTEKLFNELFHRDFQNYDQLLIEKENGSLGARFLKSITWNAFLYCRFPKK